MRSLPLLLVLAAARAGADAATPAGPRGELFEGYSPVTDRLYGPLTPAAARLLPRWLQATTDGDVTDVVFQPEGALRWRMVRGPRGLVEKTTLVDGKVWTRSSFRYDAQGRIAAKEVSGPGVGAGGWRAAYRSDERGRVVERSGDGPTWTVRWDDDGAATAETRDGEGGRRVDRWDARGNLLRSELWRDGAKRRLVIEYQRDGAGRLLRVTRRRGDGAAAAATFAKPDPTVRSEDVAAVPGLAERWEVLLVLGAPTTRRVNGAGAARTTTDYFGESCWLNQPSGLAYDAGERVLRSEVGCICGLCVDARAQIGGDEVLGRDEHWAPGPWLRLDDALEVTADHRVWTPRGPVRAGELRAGDPVLDARGRVRTLRSARRLDGGRRLGVNLRTRSGRFVAADFVLESESGECP